MTILKHLSLADAAKAFKADPTQCPWCENPELQTVDEHRNCGDVIQRMACDDCGGTLRVELSVTAAAVVHPPKALLLAGDKVRFLTKAEARDLCGKPDEDGDFMCENAGGAYSLTQDMIRLAHGEVYKVLRIHGDKVHLSGNDFTSYGLEPWMLKKVKKLLWTTSSVG